MGPRGNKQYYHADGVTCLEMVTNIEDICKACALCKDEPATCDTSNGKELPAALFCQNCFLRLMQALTLDRFKAAHVEEVIRRRNNNNGGPSTPSIALSSTAASLNSVTSPTSAGSPSNGGSSASINGSSSSA